MFKMNEIKLHTMQTSSLVLKIDQASADQNVFCPTFAHSSGSTVTILNGPILAEDKDIGINAVVTYRLLGARVDLFTVNPNSGNTVFLQRVTKKRQLRTGVSLSSSLQVSSWCVREQSWTGRRFRILGWS